MASTDMSMAHVGRRPSTTQALEIVLIIMLVTVILARLQHRRRRAPRRSQRFRVTPFWLRTSAPTEEWGIQSPTITRRTMTRRGFISASGLLGIAVIIGATANRVTFKVALEPMHDYIFALTLLLTSCYSVFYGGLLLLNIRLGVVTDKQVAFIWSRLPIYAFIGLMEACSALLAMHSGRHLPGAALTMLQQLYLVFQVSFSAILLGRRYSANQILGFWCIMAGVVLATAESTGRGSGAEMYTAAAMFGLSLLFPALASVLKERMFADAKAACGGAQLNVFAISAPGSTCQAISVLIMLIVQELLQGNSPSEHLRTGLQVLAAQPVWPLVHISVNVVFNFLVIVLVRTSSALAVTLAVSVAVPVTAIVFSVWDVPLIGRGPPLGLRFLIGLLVLFSGQALYHGLMHCPRRRRKIPSSAV